MKRILLQGFEWYLSPTDKLWKKTQTKAFDYKKDGITEIWLPPAYKGKAGVEDVGYGVYDLYDMGEFDQKGSIETKYGSKQDYMNAIDALHKQGIKVYADIVLNHKLGADATQNVRARQVDPQNRNTILELQNIEAWTVYNFDQRNNKYSDFKWNKSHFKAVDYNANNQKTGSIYLFEGKSWDENVDLELDNYDYLMGADVDLKNPEVVKELHQWGHWYSETFQLDGYRLDAVKHMDFDFYRDWITEMRKTGDKFAVGEYWSADLRALHNYLQQTEFTMNLFDVPLHFNLFEASYREDTFDMRRIFNGSLVENMPEFAVTFVDNHDTQPNQSLESYVKAWFRYHAYALILLREKGIPCVFYTDYEKDMPKLKRLMRLRSLLEGKRLDMFDDPHCIAWSFVGPTPCAVIMTNRHKGEKKMFVGKEHAGKLMVDLMDLCSDEILIDEKGLGVFPVHKKAVSVYVTKEIKDECIL